MGGGVVTNTKYTKHDVILRAFNLLFFNTSMNFQDTHLNLANSYLKNIDKLLCSHGQETTRPPLLSLNREPVVIINFYSGLYVLLVIFLLKMLTNTCTI